MIRMFKDEDMLNEAWRAQVIQEIKGQENTDRKHDSLRIYEVLRDRVKKWVMEALQKEGLKDETLVQMENRCSNISIFRKVINKLARLYVGGVERSIEENNDAEQAIDDLAKLMDFDTRLKKADRYRQAQKNCAIQVIPELDSLQSTEAQKKYNLKLRVYSPWQYDVIEDHNDRETARCIVVSDFVDRNKSQGDHIPDSGKDGRQGGLRPNFHQGDRKDQIIADHPDDAGQSYETYIWWNQKYHFTTDNAGKIINDLSPENRLNPIQYMPFATVSTDQDGQYWAQGGDDLIDGSILVNQLITDMFSLQYIQGWGQLVITGKNVSSRRIDGGPHTAIIMDHDEDDPQPSAKYISASPPIGDWLQSIEQYVALLLTTNDLSVNTVSTKLDMANFPSGVAMIVDQAEAVNSTEDSEKEFRKAERELWEITKRWQNLMLEKKALTKEFEEIGKIENAEVNVKYHEIKPIMSEKEKLENIKVRKDLGINEEIDLIIMDNPEMSREEAEAKLMTIKAEKLNNMKEVMQNALDSGDEESQDEEENPEDQSDRIEE